MNHRRTGLCTSVLRGGFNHEPIVFLAGNFSAHVASGLCPRHGISAVCSGHSLRGVFGLRAVQADLGGICISGGVTNECCRRNTVGTIYRTFNGGGHHGTLLIVTANSNGAEAIVTLYSVLLRRN